MELFPHNQRAYHAVCSLLMSKGKAAVIHPTGTGKSFIAFRLVLDNLDANFLWLSPSEYIFRMQMENLFESLMGSETEKEVLLQTLNEKLHFMTYTRLTLCTDTDFKRSVDYIILDEFHRCGAAEWGKGVERLLLAYPSAKLLGLSKPHRVAISDILSAGCFRSISAPCIIRYFNRYWIGESWIVFLKQRRLSLSLMSAALEISDKDISSAKFLWI